MISPIYIFMEELLAINNNDTLEKALFILLGNSDFAMSDCKNIIERERKKRFILKKMMKTVKDVCSHLNFSNYELKVSKYYQFFTIRINNETFTIREEDFFDSFYYFLFNFYKCPTESQIDYYELITGVYQLNTLEIGVE